MPQNPPVKPVKPVNPVFFLRGGSQVLSLSKMIFKMTFVHVPRLVSQTSEAIFGPLTHIGTGVGLDRIFDSKIQILK